MVVYYDQSTSSDSFLTERTNDERLTVLKRLYHALGDFAYQKPLKRPPVLLAGGLTAWVEMFGSSSLKYGSLISSPPPPSKSAGVGLGISSFQKSTTSMHTTTDERLRGGPSRKKDEIHYAPLINIAEERDWLEKLQKDREPLTISVPRDAGNMDVKRQRRSTSIVSSSDSYPRTVEQFVGDCIPYPDFILITFLVPAMVSECPAVNDDPNTGYACICSFHPSYTRVSYEKEHYRSSILRIHRCSKPGVSSSAVTCSPTCRCSSVGL